MATTSTVTVSFAAEAKLSKAEFGRLVIETITRPKVSRYNADDDGRSRLQHVMDDICRMAQSGQLPYMYWEIAYGVSRAVGTGRINGATVLALREMKVRQLVELVHTIRCHIPPQGMEEIASYLHSLDLWPSYIRRESAN